MTRAHADLDEYERPAEFSYPARYGYLAGAVDNFLARPDDLMWLEHLRRSRDVIRGWEIARYISDTVREATIAERRMEARRG